MPIDHRLLAGMGRTYNDAEEQGMRNALYSQQAKRQNVLLDQEIAAQPKRDQLLDLQIQGAQQGLTQDAASFSDQQRTNAAGIMANHFAAISRSQNPKIAAQQLVSSPQFQQAAQVLGWDQEMLGRFTNFDPGATDDTVRWRAQDVARSLGSQIGFDAGLPAELQTFNAMTQGLSPDETSQARRIQLGLQSRAGQGRVTNVGGVPTYVGMGDDGQPVQIPLSSLQGEAGAAAQIAGSETAARAAAQNEADFAKQAAANRTVLNTWEATSKSLMDALAGTVTGPVVGSLWAVTADQQTADGAIAAAAPVLKQIFRVAGEGTFTDRDQALLIEMLPTRTDHPAARVAKMQMVDMIVRAKLGAPPAGQGGDTGGEPAQIQTDEQYNALPSGTRYRAPDGSVRTKR